MSKVLLPDKFKWAISVLKDKLTEDELDALMVVVESTALMRYRQRKAIIKDEYKTDNA